MTTPTRGTHAAGSIDTAMPARANAALPAPRTRWSRGEQANSVEKFHGQPALPWCRSTALTEPLCRGATGSVVNRSARPRCCVCTARSCGTGEAASGCRMRCTTAKGFARFRRDRPVARVGADATTLLRASACSKTTIVERWQGVSSRAVPK